MKKELTMKNIFDDIRWNRSPFTLGVLSSIGAVLLDFIWAAAEVLRMIGVIDIVFAVHMVLLIGFLICIAVLIYSLVIYVRQGYAKREKLDEMQHELNELKTKYGIRDRERCDALYKRSPFINN